MAGAILKGDAAAILQSVEAFDSAGKNMRRLAGELLRHFRNLIVFQSLGGQTASLEATPDQVKTLAEQAKLCDASRIFRVADQLAAMEDKLRYALSVRTLIEMTLLRAARIASVASIEELMRAVRALAAQGGGGGGEITRTPQAPQDTQDAKTTKAAPPPAPKPAAMSAKPAARPQLSPEEQRKMMDDPKLNAFLAALPGAKVTAINP